MAVALLGDVPANFLVFASLQIMEAVLGREGFGFCRLDGTITKTSDRQKIVNRFNKDHKLLGGWRATSIGAITVVSVGAECPSCVALYGVSSSAACLLTTGVGAVGLTLTGADRCVLPHTMLCACARGCPSPIS